MTNHVLFVNVTKHALRCAYGMEGGTPVVVQPGGILTIPSEYADGYDGRPHSWQRAEERRLVTKPARGRGRRPVSRTSSVGKRPAKSKAAVSTAAASEVNREGLSA